MQAIVFENVSRPGQPIAVGDTFRADVPTVPKGSNDYWARTYPIGHAQWGQQVDCLADGTGTFTLTAPAQAGDLLNVHLLNGSSFRRDPLAFGSFVIA